MNTHSRKMSQYYSLYSWGNQDSKGSHHDLYDLENNLSSRENQFVRPLPSRRYCRMGWASRSKNYLLSRPFANPLYSGRQPALCHYYDPVNTICMIEGRVKGFGPTFSSKLLHFSIPQIFGAIDTRLVRVFGNESEDPDPHHFLNLDVNRPEKGRPAITKTQQNWPENTVLGWDPSIYGGSSERTGNSLSAS